MNSLQLYKQLLSLIIVMALSITSVISQTQIEIYNDGEIIFSDYVSNIDSIKIKRATQHQGKEYVDLGLPSGVKWATCNVGAETPEGYGDYFSHGEIETKLSYYESSYHGYCFIDYLPLSRDAANYNWGGKWRIPTTEEQKELLENCTWEWVTKNGVNGSLGTSKINGNTIFLPAAGFCNEDGIKCRGGECVYWSSSVTKASFYSSAMILGSQNRYATNYGAYSYYGSSIRPVYDENTKFYSVTVKVNNYQCNKSYCYACTYYTGVRYGSAVPVFAQSQNTDYALFVNWTLNGEIISEVGSFDVVVTDDIELVANFKSKYATSGKNEGYDYVDLGLPSGVKWAAYNIGATKPEEFGKYYSWGDTYAQTSYTLQTYSYTSNPENLPLEDDVANKSWGGSWRMPTEIEIEELLENCNCTWGEKSGVKGYTLTSKINGFSIFLPASGWYYDTTYNASNTAAYYWSNTRAYNTYRAHCIYLSSDKIEKIETNRFYGFSVRPVCQ